MALQNKNKNAAAKNNHTMMPQFQFQQQQHTTTIFDPSIVKEYQLMVPDAAERIFKILEQNNKAEAESRSYGFKETRRRDWMAFSTIILIVALSGFSAWQNKPWISGISLVSAIGAIVAGLIHKKNKNG